jgi:dihydrofolate reductase
MRKVVFGGANSLDNYFARKDGSVDWLMWSPEAGEIMKDMWSRFDVMLMGRKTWDASVANFSEEELEQARKMSAGMKTYIFSRTREAGPIADRTEVTGEDPAEVVRRLKAEDGKDIMLMGGGDLARSLFEAGLIDEVGFNIHPVLLGSGVPLFHEMSRQIDLELIESRAFKNGCVYVLYRVKN